MAAGRTKKKKGKTRKDTGKKSGRKSKKTEGKDSFDKRMEDFGEEVGKLGEEFGERFGEAFGREMEHRAHKFHWWCFSTLGLIGPIIGSLVGTLFLAIVFWIVYGMAALAGVEFIEVFATFLLKNIAVFFLLFLYSGYKDYFSKAFPQAYKPLSPILGAFGLTIVVWILVKAADVSNLSLQNAVLESLVSFFQGKLAWVFLFFTLVGYLLLFVGKYPGVNRGEWKH